MAEAIGDGLTDAGVEHKLLHAAVDDRNDIITEVFRSGLVVIGSPTINNGVLPTIAPLLEDLRGLKFQNKLGAAFGCYGWSGESVKLLEKHLTEVKIPLVREGIKLKWQPRNTDLEKCRVFGNELGEKVKSSTG
jgi:flavorubredoxin